MKSIDKVVTPKEAAEILGITPRRVQIKCKAGQLVCRKAGDTWLIEKSSLKRPE